MSVAIAQATTQTIADQGAGPSPARIPRYRLTTSAFQRMIAAGILSAEERIELIEGALFAMSPIDPEHSAIVNQLAALLIERRQRAAIVSIQCAVHLDKHTQPQPDIALLQPRADFYKRSLPTSSDVLLVVEVADSSLAYDRNTKMVLYARAGIAEAWIVNLADRWVEVYRDPAAVGYMSMRRVLPGQDLAPLAFPQAAVAVGVLFV